MTTKAEELALWFIETGREETTLPDLLRQYGRLVQEAAAKELDKVVQSAFQKAGDYRQEGHTAIAIRIAEHASIIEKHAKAIREMPLP